jgi:hypothetical protein
VTGTRACKDCLAELVVAPGQRPPVKLRPAPHPGPRCATHHRVALVLRRAAARDKRIEQTYGLTAEEYDALLAFQGGTCAICQRATGKARRLAVDHDHKQAVLDGHDEEKACQMCRRGLCCRPCNRMLGHLRDDPTAFERAADYLRNWPTARARSASATAASTSASPGSSAAGAPGTASSGERT